MAQTRTLKVLLICPWVTKVPRVDSHQIVRVDFAAAMRAALVHHRFDAAFYFETPSLPYETADACIREHAPRLALARITRLDQIGPELAKLRS